MSKLSSLLVGAVIFFNILSLPPVHAQELDEKSRLPLQNVDLKNNNSLYKYGQQSKGLEGKIVVVDAGHGGSDVGAIGPSNTKEKDFTLAISKELKTLLERNKAVVVMTRNSDKDVSNLFANDIDELQARVNIGNKAKGDIFISIHIDSFENALARGTTTYYYSQDDRAALLAQYVETGMVNQLRLQNRGSLKNDFYVLKNTNMPAVLTEVAYISNPDEEKMLQNKAFIRKAAEGMFNGIEKYFSS